MTISTNKNISYKKPKKIIFIISISMLVTILGFLAYRPILNKFEQDHFAKLDTQMQKLYNSVRAASDKSDVWIYEKNCEPEYSGPWQTGSYYCTVKISMSKTVTSAKEVADLQNKYYPIIDGSEVLIAKSELDPQLPDDFGVNFVVSSAEKRYEENDTKVLCTYLNKLYQTTNSTDFSINKYGSIIKNGLGDANLSLTCSGKSYENRY